MKYDPAFCSRKRLAHLALRDKPEPPAPEPTPAERLRAFYASKSSQHPGSPRRGQAIPRRFVQPRAQALADRRAARGERWVANYERRRECLSPYHFPILPDYGGPLFDGRDPRTAEVLREDDPPQEPHHSMRGPKKRRR